jgi:hypothetical protein
MLAAAACAADAEPNAVDSSGGSDTSTTGDSSSSSGGVDLPTCPGGSNSTALVVDAARPDDASEESDSISNAGPCTIDSTGGDAQTGWVLSMTCDLSGLEPAAPVELRITQAASPFVGLALDQPVALTLDRWWAFEFGGGTLLRLEQAEQVVLVAASEVREGGFVGLCADPADEARIDADAWLAAIEAHLEVGECDPDGTLGVVRTVDGEAVSAYPGEAVALGDLQIVVGDTRCTVNEGGSESWAFGLTAWRE